MEGQLQLIQAYQKATSLQGIISDAWRPPEFMTVSDWADRYRMLSPEASAEPGRWRTDRVPYLRSVMNAIEEPGIRQLVLMFNAQSGKSEALLNALGKMIHLSPCPILFLQPTLEMAESFSKERLSPMLRDTPVLAGTVKESRSRDSNNTLLHKGFPGGHLTLAGANSPSSLASRPIQFLLCDEIDRYPASAGAEGDPVSIAMRRTATFWNRFVIMVSTPTIAGLSRIEKAWEGSDQRRCFVPCPVCGGFQALEWDQVVYPGKGTESPEPKAIGYRCGHCETVFGESARVELLRGHEWRKTSSSDGVAGFHLNALYSPWQSWIEMAQEWEIARKDSLLLRVWVNTMLGLPWEDTEGTGLEWEMLLQRSSESEYAFGEIPERVVLLTAGVDVQGDRLAVALWGWAEESWLIDYSEIIGDPLEDTTWDILESYLGTTYAHPLGGTIACKLACIDTGYLTQDVYQQVKRRRSWYAIKGKGGDRAIVSRPSWQELNWQGKVLKRGIKLYTLGVDKAKEVLYSRSKIKPGRDKAVNLPKGLDDRWCQGFCSEVQVLKTIGGQTVARWEKLQGVANEPLDTAIYAMTAAELCGATRLDWEKERLKRETAKDAPPPPQADQKKWVTGQEKSKRWV